MTDDTRPDPALIARLDQATSKFNDDMKTFEETYGFTHDCHCASDLSSGMVGEAPLCFFGMVEDAMGTCAELNAQNKAWEVIASEFSTLAEHFFAKLKEEMGEDISS